MALDPFFQQGMNAWGDRIKAQEGRARGLGAMVDAGQIKDLLQRTGHQQKLTEADRTGEWDVTGKGLERGLTSTRAAPLFNTQVTPDVQNVLASQRRGEMIKNLGGLKSMSDAGWRVQRGGGVNVGTMQDVLRNLKMAPGPSTSVAAAKAQAKVTEGTEGTEIYLPGQGWVPGPTRKRKSKVESRVSPNQPTVTATQKRVQDVIEGLRQKGVSVKKGNHPKFGPIYTVTDPKTKRRTMFSQKDGTVVAKE